MSDTLVIQVQDSAGATALATYLIPVDFVVVITSSLPNASVGSPYSATVIAAGGFGALTYSMSATPNTSGWLSINPLNGVLSGTPGTTEVESVTIQATDPLGQSSAPVTLSFLVGHPASPFNAAALSEAIFDSAWRPIPSPWQKTPAVMLGVQLPQGTWLNPLPTGTVGVAYGYTLTAQGGVPPYTYGVAAGYTLPAGLSLVGATIQGTPTTPVSLQAENFTVTDSAT